ncbi:MAG: hypothetical protein HYX48_00850 [Chlamydiales bacterium]|nr:hypothetical protein [Chlamydiales bacterium]
MTVQQKPNLMIDKLQPALVAQVLSWGFLSKNDLRIARTCKVFSQVRLFEITARRCEVAVPGCIKSRNCANLTSVRVLDRNWQEASIMQLLQSVKTLRKLELPAGSSFSEALARKMSEHPALRAVDVTVLDDKQLEQAASIKPLTRLSIQSKITDVGFAHLSKAQNLVELRLNACGQISSPHPLRSLGLARLVIGQCPKDPASLAQDCRYCGFTGTPLVPQLLDDAFFSYLFTNATTLHTVDLSNVKNPSLGEGLLPLGSLPLLRTLNIDRCLVALEAIEAIGRCTQIQTLRFTQNGSDHRLRKKKEEIAAASGAGSASEPRATRSAEESRVTEAHVLKAFAQCASLVELELHSLPAAFLNQIQFQLASIQKLASSLPKLNKLIISTKEPQDSFKKSLAHLKVVSIDVSVAAETFQKR